MSAGRTVYGLLEKDHKTTFKNLNLFYETLGKLRQEGKAGARRNLAQIGRLATFFQREIDGHMKEEERTLFPFLQSHIPRLEPMIYLLRSEHDDFRHCLKTLKKVLAKCPARKGPGPVVMETLQDCGTYLTCLMRSHMWCESHSLYKAADEELRPSEKKELIREIRRQRIRK